MVVLPRNEINRIRTGGVLSLILGTATIVAIASVYGSMSDLQKLGLLALGAIAAAAIVISLLQVVWHRDLSKAIIFHQGERMVVAVNYLHDGFRLRFFRDVLNDNMVSFSDEERRRWSALEKEGYHPVLNVRNVRKPYLLSLCFMVFDDVYVLDHTERWDYFDCRNTSEPTFSRRGVSPFKDDSVVRETAGQPAT